VQDLQFERHLISGAIAMKLYSTANATTATCVNVQYMENQGKGFRKPADKPDSNTVQVKISF